MDKICDNCMYCYKPTSIKDYFDKTLTTPNLRKWGIDVFKHEFWLCGSHDVSKIDHTNNTLVYKPCICINKRGNCEYFKTPDAENIIPSTVTIAPTEPLPEKIVVGDDITLEVTAVPANENTQEISYSYQWFKNGRKLYKETKSTLKVDTSEVSVSTYCCKLINFTKKQNQLLR